MKLFESSSSFFFFFFSLSFSPSIHPSIHRDYDQSSGQLLFLSPDSGLGTTFRKTFRSIYIIVTLSRWDVYISNLEKLGENHRSKKRPRKFDHRKIRSGENSSERKRERKKEGEKEREKEKGKVWSRASQTDRQRHAPVDIRNRNGWFRSAFLSPNFPFSFNPPSPRPFFFSLNPSPHVLY